ncbi:carboxypeptidase regulatory-like domain-containing protein [Sorangium sp. So ce381]|uniref:carboxypeptidase regulatory-like domain-containing protein n=1 Tax=Sorangium sp. So ce381 TaxID=3133307 RepID=UPI003F5B8AD9
MQPPVLHHDTPRRWPLWCALAALALAAFLLLRLKHDAPRAALPEPAAPSSTHPTHQQKSGYVNRARWDRPAAPLDQAATEVPPISGTVYDLSGAPVAGVTIAATTFDVAGNFPTTAASAESDEHGRFEIRAPNGTYNLVSNKEGYGPMLVVAHSGDDVALLLPRSGIVDGHVYNERKEPITEFTVDIVALSPDSTAAPAPLWSKRFDAADGAFRVEQVPGWPVFLRVTAADYAPVFSAPVHVGPDKTQNVELTLSHGCTLTGTVHDENGAPLVGIFLDAETRFTTGSSSQGSMDAASQAQSDLEGRFRLEHVPPGEILVRAYDGGYAATTAQVQVAQCDALDPIQLRMSRGGSVAGVVRGSDGKPVAGAQIMASHRSIGFVNAVTDAEGRYRFEKLPAAVMRLELVAKSQHTVVYANVSEGQVVERDISLPADSSGEIRGRITSGGKPLRGVQVVVACNQGEPGLDMRHVTTSNDGTYRATGLPDGAYMVMVSSAVEGTSAVVRDGGVAQADLDVAGQPQPEDDSVAPAHFTGD